MKKDKKQDSKELIEPIIFDESKELIEPMIFYELGPPLNWAIDQELTPDQIIFPNWWNFNNYSAYNYTPFDISKQIKRIDRRILDPPKTLPAATTDDKSLLTRQSKETSAIALSNNTYCSTALTHDFYVYTKQKNTSFLDLLNYISPEERQKLYDKFEWNDAGDADLIYVILNNNLIYVTEEKLFYLWNGKIWNEICNEELKNFVTNILQERYMYKKYTATGKELEYFRKSCDNKKIDDVISLLKTKIYIREKQLNQTTYLLCVSNGIIDFKKGHIFNHAMYKSNYITKMIEIKYIGGYRNYVFDNFINSIMEYDNEKINFLQKAFGYAIIGDPKEQKCFILKGDGSNGKSTLIEAVRNVLSEGLSCVIPKNILTCEDRNSGNSASPVWAQLKDKLIAFTSEMKNTDVLVESQFKKLIGGGVISARYLYKNTIEFKPKFTLFIDSNFLPKISDASDNEAYAIFRRIIIIPFNARFDENNRDTELSNKLASDDSKMAILSWLIDGAFEYMQNGYLDPTLEMQRELDLYIMKENSILNFMNNCIIHTNQYDDRIGSTELYNHYASYCEQNDIHAVTKSKFFKSQPIRTLNYLRKSNFRGYNYIKLKEIE